MAKCCGHSKYLFRSGNFPIILETRGILEICKRVLIKYSQYFFKIKLSSEGEERGKAVERQENLKNHLIFMRKTLLYLTGKGKGT